MPEASPEADGGGWVWWGGGGVCRWGRGVAVWEGSGRGEAAAEMRYFRKSGGRE